MKSQFLHEKNKETKNEESNFVEAKEKEESSLLMAILDEHKDILLQGLYGEIFGDSWYLDAGASSHMTSSKFF